MKINTQPTWLSNSTMKRDGDKSKEVATKNQDSKHFKISDKSQSVNYFKILQGDDSKSTSDKQSKKSNKGPIQKLADFFKEKMKDAEKEHQKVRLQLIIRLLKIDISPEKFNEFLESPAPLEVKIKKLLKLAGMDGSKKVSAAVAELKNDPFKKMMLAMSLGISVADVEKAISSNEGGGLGAIMKALVRLSQEKKGESTMEQNLTSNLEG
ncbi:hypothetical protein [Agarilytica rhodophyticola]|uniref:hypothetical protein n=1 Tax=Agarilytica rhodophyticola TaxID=1737490 RepID=UPI000B346B8B|nr:hypothetical protein [Agarilytica rhodophyticola]